MYIHLSHRHFRSFTKLSSDIVITVNPFLSVLIPICDVVSFASFPLLFRTSASATILLSHHSPISTFRYVGESKDRVLYVSIVVSGASSPEWVKPTAEGGGLLVIYVLSYLRWFCDFTFLSYFRFLFCPHSHYG
jgi:hypothetical protein